MRGRRRRLRVSHELGEPIADTDTVEWPPRSPPPPPLALECWQRLSGASENGTSVRAQVAVRLSVERTGVLSSGRGPCGGAAEGRDEEGAETAPWDLCQRDANLPSSSEGGGEADDDGYGSSDEGERWSGGHCGRIAARGSRSSFNGQESLQDEGRGKDNDEWEWSGELWLSEAQLGKRQHVLVRNEGGSVWLLSCELSKNERGVRQAVFFEDQQPPLLLRNLTGTTLHVCVPGAAKGEQVQLGAGRHTAYAHGSTPASGIGSARHAAAMLKRSQGGFDSAAKASSSGVGSLQLGLSAAEASAADPFVLSPPRRIRVSLGEASSVWVSIAQHGPSTQLSFEPTDLEFEPLSSAANPTPVPKQIAAPYLTGDSGRGSGRDGTTTTAAAKVPMAAARVALASSKEGDVGLLRGLKCGLVFEKVSVCLWLRLPPSLGGRRSSSCANAAVSTSCAEVGASERGDALMQLTLQGLSCLVDHSSPSKGSNATEGLTALNVLLKSAQLDNRLLGAAYPVVVCADPPTATPPPMLATALPMPPLTPGPQLHLTLVIVHPAHALTLVEASSAYSTRYRMRSPGFVQLLTMHMQPLALCFEDSLLRALAPLWAELGHFYHALPRNCAAAMSASADTSHTGYLREHAPTLRLVPFATSARAPHTKPTCPESPPLPPPRSPPLLPLPPLLPSPPLPPPLYFVEHLEISAISLMLTASTFGTRRSPLHFAALQCTGLLGSRQALLSTLASKYGFAVLAHSAALVGSLQLLGNPSFLLHSLSEGVSDALRLPLRGAPHGPGHFVAGLAAGASSLLLHMSHGALASISDFTSAVARNIETGPDEEPVQGHHDGAERDGLARRPSALLRGMGLGLLGALTKPVGGALGLVSAASEALSTVAASHSPLHALPLPPLPPPGYPSAMWFSRALLPMHERYVCHVAVTPLGPAREGAARHVLLLSTATMYEINVTNRRIVHTLAMHQLIRLEASEASEASGASTTADMSGGAAFLAIFLSPVEAQRLRIPSCVQYSLSVASQCRFIEAHKQQQLTLALEASANAR